MSFLNLFNKKIKVENKKEQSINDSNNQTKANDSNIQTKANDLNQIWNKEDKNDLITSLDDYLSLKCEYGEKIEILQPCERIFYLCQAFEREINNGGFSQFFFNSSGNFTKETVTSLVEIGAIKTSELLKKAISIFPTDIVPEDWNERQELLDKVLNDENEEALNELDESFYRYEDNLLELNYNYTILNKQNFS